MSNLAVVSKPEAYELALIQGDLSKLTTEERVNYYRDTCESLGLNPLTKPFEYITLNGKLTLYAKRECTEQLRNLRSISLEIVSRQQANDVYVVTARAKFPNGRCDESTGAVNVAGLRGDILANAYMRAETKAKRRVTLSICGLGMLDETEVETIENAQRVKSEQTDVAPIQIEQSVEPEKSEPKDPGEYLVTVGKKFNGKRLKEIPVIEIANFCAWIDTLKDASTSLLDLRENARLYLESKRGEI